MQKNIREMLGEYGTKLGSLLHSPVIRYSTIGLGAAATLLTASLHVGGDRNRLIKCYVNAKMEHEFHKKHPPELYPNCNGCTDYPEMERTFISAHSIGESPTLSVSPTILEKLDAEGGMLRNQLTKNLESHLESTVIDVGPESIYVYNCK